MCGVFVVKYGYHKEVKMKRSLIAMFACCAAIALASSAAARTVAVDSLAGTNATVTVGPGEATEYLGLAYGNTDGYANPGVGWDAIASLAAVPAAGGTYAVTLPFDPLTNATYRYSRFVLAEHPFDTRLDYLPGNGKTYFDTGITNASTDSVEIAIRVSSFGSSYSGIFGARAGASEKNLSVFCSKDCEVYVDFNSSVANTYRASPRFPAPSGGSAHDVTIAISAAERHVDVFRDGAAVSSIRGSSTNRTACAFYGCRNAAGSRNISMFVDGSCFYCDFNNGNYDTYRLKNVPRSTAHRYRMVNSAARRVAERLQDGAVVGTSSNTKACADVFTCAGSAYLFAANDMSGGSPAVLWSSNGLPSIRFYSLDVTTTDGAACCSIRPCKRGGVGEVYDSVRNRYFQNIGTGSFAFGCKGTALAVSDLITPQTKFYTGFMVIVH